MSAPETASTTTTSKTPRPLDPCLTILLLLWPAMVILVLAHLRATSQPAQMTPPMSAVDPNIAPWWELSVLPRIGPGTAQEIVRFRQTTRQDSRPVDKTRVFRRVADLAQIRGIGPKTLQRIGRYLRIDDD